MGFLRLFLSFVAGLIIISTAVYFTAEDPLVFLNLPGLIIVLGGTVTATLISYPIATITNAFRSVGSSLTLSNQDIKSRIHDYSESMKVLKTGDLKNAEAKIKHIHSPFLVIAAKMMIDGTPSADIMKTLNWHMERVKAADQQNSDVFLTMASYAPAFGMVGTLIGLINMLGTMSDGNFEHIGANMAVALITTFYGILLANIVFKPLAVKLELKSHADLIALTVAKEAVEHLSTGKSAAYTKDLLNKFLDHDNQKIL